MGRFGNGLVAEGVAISLAAMVVGIVVGVTLSVLVISFFNVLSPISFSYAVPWQTLAALVAMTVVLSVVTTWQPAARVSRKAVVDLLRRAT